MAHVNALNRCPVAIATISEDTKGRDWDANIGSIQWALNNFKNTTTKISPQNLIMTYQPRDITKNKLLLALHNIIEQEEEENISIAELKTKVLERINHKQQNQAEKFNATHKKPQKYQQGDLVLIRYDPIATGQSRKVQPRYKGPYIVKAVLNNDRYIVTDSQELQVTRKPYESVQSAERMKPWCKLADLDFDEEIDEEIDEER